MIASHPHNRFRRVLTSRPAILVWSLVVIWAVLPFLPENSGFQFSWVYRIFFSAMALIGVLFFWFLAAKPIHMPQNPGAAFGLVLFLTVVLLVSAGIVYPTYPVPSPPVKVNGAVALGEQVFYTPSSSACYRCHTINGRGGVRGPNLSTIASIAGSLVPGVSAAQFLTLKIEQGALYKYRAPKFSPIMVPYKTLLATAQIKDLVAYLLTLK